MTRNVWMEILPINHTLEPGCTTRNAWQASVAFNGKQKGEQGKAQHTISILPPEKKQELLISENNARKPNGFLGNKREQPSIPLHTTCTVADINYMLIRHPSTPTRQSRTNTKHTRTNNLQCLLTDPNSISPCEVSLKKALKGPEQSLTQPFTRGKELVLQAARSVF